VRVAPHDRFTREGVDIHCEQPISFAQAALGAHLEFETLDGTEDLVIPRGTPSGTLFRLRGRGVPHLERRSRGDLIVRVVVDVPTDLDAEDEELLRTFAERRGEAVAPADAGFLSRIRSAFR
jgi:molecular chaperone DnaJ